MSTLVTVAARAHGMSREAYQRDVCPVLFSLFDLWEPPPEFGTHVTELAYLAVGTAGDEALTERRRVRLRKVFVSVLVPALLDVAAQDLEADPLKVSAEELRRDGSPAVLHQAWTRVAAARAGSTATWRMTRKVRPKTRRGSWCCTKLGMTRSRARSGPSSGRWRGPWRSGLWWGFPMAPPRVPRNEPWIPWRRPWR